MTLDHETALALYKRLISLYPRSFREQLGESMAQTFSDLYYERRQARRSQVGFVLGAFAETGMGITREHIHQLTHRGPMKTILADIRLPAILSFLSLLPFALLEVVNRQRFWQSKQETFPVVLFVFLWVLPVVFLYILIPIVRNVRAGNSLLAQPVSLSIKVVILIFIAWLWGNIIIDQMPCFLGVPNCD